MGLVEVQLSEKQNEKLQILSAPFQQHTHNSLVASRAKRAIVCDLLEPYSSSTAVCAVGVEFHPTKSPIHP